MASRFPPHVGRSKDAPMDYQWTDRSPVKPAWATGTDETSTRKRSHDALNPSSSLLSNSPQPTFGTNQNIPFLFHPPTVPQTPQSHAWAPPPQFSPSKAFPLPLEVKDVDMAEISPFRNGEETSGMDLKDKDSIRPVATGGLRRVFKQRNKRHETRLTTQRHRPQEEGDAASASDSDSDHEKSMTPMNQTTSHHYTLNMPAPAPAPSELPYILLGYLQFLFNLSLILIFLYLFVQFIITVQRDVGHRIVEYQQDVIQEIRMCATQYKNNLCATSPIPAMVQQCANWESCMKRDAVVVGRAKVGAELIAEVINGFVEPISWKTLIFTLTSLAFLTVFINTLLSLYRSKHLPITDLSPHPNPPFPIPQNMSWPYRTDQDMESSTRRRRLEGGIAAKIK